jgi:hypothetical protein
MAASVAAVAATWRLTRVAAWIASLRRSSPYHFVENPAQTVTRRDSLKL